MIDETNSLFRAVVEQSADAIVIVENTTTVFANDAYLRLVGVTDHAAVIGSTGDRWLHPDDRQLVNERALARQRGEDVPSHYEFRVIRAGGDVRTVEVAATLITHDGHPATLAILRDVTERKRADLAQRLLTEAGRILASSLEYETTLTTVASLVVPTFAEWSTIYLRDGRHLLCAAVSHADPEGKALLSRLQERYPHRAGQPDAVTRVVQTGQPLLAASVGPDALGQHAQDEEHLRLLRQLDTRTSIIVPLVARGQITGALALSRGASGAPYRREDVALAQQLASLCAAAIENARLYREAQQRADDLTRLSTALRQTAEARDAALAEAVAARDQLDRVLSRLNDHYVAYDREWRYVFVNDAAARVLGRPKEALLGERIWDLFPDAIGNEYYLALHRALAEQRDVVFEFYYRPFDRWFENHVYASPEGVSVLSTDISERRRAQPNRSA